MSLYSEKVVQLATVYLGPAAKTFLERQTISHLKGLVLENLQKEHLPELAKWVGISAGLIIDKAKAAELANKIKDL
jgi:hypothetical protein